MHPKTRRASIYNTCCIGRRYWTSRCYFRLSGRLPSAYGIQLGRTSLTPGFRSAVLRRFLMLIVRTPVRISFGGGGTDLPAYYQKFGGAVLSTAINKHFYTILQKRVDGKVQVISSDLRVVETWEDISRMSVKGTELEIPLSVMKELGCAVSFNLFFPSEFPPGIALGSWQVVCGNVVRTLTTSFGFRLPSNDLPDGAF